MADPRFRVTINGFWCRSETWDDSLNWDGKHDEVFLAVNTKEFDADGKPLVPDLNSESELMGDTWNLPNRVQVGTASDRGGIVTGDRFPLPNPWQRSTLNTQRVPPYTIWEGDLPAKTRMVFLTPTIWEWDPGTGAWDGWLSWQVGVDSKFGQRAKDAFGGIWPVSKPVFDAVSVGLQTAGTLQGIWSPLGKSWKRPIGVRRDPNNQDGYLFNPTTIALNSDTAEYLTAFNGQGLGSGIFEIRYVDDDYLRGEYSVFVQVEKLSGGGSPSVFLQPGWLWCNKCQALFFGDKQPESRCPAGGLHAARSESHSGAYSLPLNAPPVSDRQSPWYWCNKCQGLFWRPAFAQSVCAAGGTHAPQAQSGSGTYSLSHNIQASPDTQDDWRWCSNCQGLFWGGGQAQSRCPKGGPHTSASVSHSGNYSLPHQPD